LGDPAEIRTEDHQSLKRGENFAGNRIPAAEKDGIKLFILKGKILHSGKGGDEVIIIPESHKAFFVAHKLTLGRVSGILPESSAVVEGLQLEGVAVFDADVSFEMDPGSGREKDLAGKNVSGAELRPEPIGKNGIFSGGIFPRESKGCKAVLFKPGAADDADHGVCKPGRTFVLCSCPDCRKEKKQDPG
jgi:hypothetical protein